MILFSSLRHPEVGTTSAFIVQSRKQGPDEVLVTFPHSLAEEEPSGSRGGWLQSPTNFSPHAVPSFSEKANPVTRQAATAGKGLNAGSAQASTRRALHSPDVDQCQAF